MKRQRILMGAVALAVLLLGLLVGLSVAQGPQPPRQLAPEVALGSSSTFTYQGRLQSGGEPVDDECEFLFTLHDASELGNQIGITQTDTISLTEGLFAAQLDFGPTAFSGEARWLGIRVKCPDDGGFSDLDRQPLSAAPYAMHAATARQLVENFVVRSGESISAGDVVAFTRGEAFSGEADGGASVFNPAQTEDIAVISLSATDFVIAYNDAENDSYGTAIVGSISGGNLNWGIESVFNFTDTRDIAVSSLSASEFVIAYQDKGNSDHGTVITGTVSGGNLSWGAESVFNAADTSEIAVSGLSTTDFVVAYKDGGNSGHGTVITGSIGGGSLSWGIESVFNISPTTDIAVSSLSDSDFVVAYQDEDNSAHGTAIAGSISGGSLNLGAESVFNASATAGIALSSLSATDFVVAYRDGGSTLHGVAITGSVSGGGILWGTESEFNASSTYDIAVSSLSATDFAVAYSDSGPSGYVGSVITGTVSEGSLSWGPESVFNMGSTTNIAASSLSDFDYVIAFLEHDGCSGFRGAAILGSQAWRVGQQLIGTAKTAASGSEMVPVIISGVSDVHSGLVPGLVYYLQTDGSLSPARTDYRVGLAISESELLLDQLW